MNEKELLEACAEKKINAKYIHKQLIQKKVCMTKDVGVHNNLFGGNLLSWIDESAASHISEMIGFRPVVTLKISEVLFKEPVKVHDVINIDGTVLCIGNSSIKLLIEVLNVKTLKQVCTCEMVFVHVDANSMKSIAI